MRKTKIICTIGPASDTEETLEKMVIAGLDVMRLNFSHGTHEEQLKKVKLLQKINKKLNKSVAFMLDTKGPEIRIGTFADNKEYELIKGNKFTLTIDDIEGNNDIVSVTYKNIVNDVEVGEHILLDDGLIELQATKVTTNNIECIILNNGFIKSKKGLNLPETKLHLKSLTPKDKEDIKFAFDNSFDYIAASFVRNKEDVLDIKNYLDTLGDNNIKIISKIENQDGIDNFDEILKVTDGIMVARGDLGVEIAIEEIPSVQKYLIRKTLAAGKLVITATQMLESMQKNPRPTRAEVSDVANSVYDSTSAIMLSGETASGIYPIESVETMVKIAVASEKNIDSWRRFKRKHLEKYSPNDSLYINDEYEFKKQANFSVCFSAMNANATAILAVTETGETASILSSFRPGCPIYVVTANINTYRQMSLEHNVTAIYIKDEYNFKNIIDKGIEILKEKKLLKTNDIIILSGGSKTTNYDFSTNHITGTIIKI